MDSQAARKQNYAIAAAFLLGAALLSVAFLREAHPLTIVLVAASAICMWRAHILRLDIEAKNRQ